jgi:DNA-3-methyladenine glycosylase I
MSRCAWAKTELSIPYHDREWGVPVHDDRVLFEFLNLEGAQAGLSWETILKKRETYRAAFGHWDARKIARYDARKVAKLLAPRPSQTRTPSSPCKRSSAASTSSCGSSSADGHCRTRAAA